MAGRTPEGTAYADERNGVTFVVQVTAAAEGNVQTGTEVVAAAGGWDALPGFDPARWAALAARRALLKLEAPTVRAGEIRSLADRFAWSSAAGTRTGSSRFFMPPPSGGKSFRLQRSLNRRTRRHPDNAPSTSPSAAGHKSPNRWSRTDDQTNRCCPHQPSGGN